MPSRNLSFLSIGRLSSPTSLGKLSWLLFLLFGLTYAYFVQEGGNANVFCRAALAVNLVQDGRVDINGYDHGMIDLASHGGNFYCDKAPGMSFLALPVAYAFTFFYPLSPAIVAANERVWYAFIYLCAHATSALLVALAAVLLFRYLFGRTKSVAAAIIGSIAFGFGTPMFGWATSFFSHAAAGALLIMGLMAFDLAARQLTDRRRALWLAALSGVVFGAATAVEYTSLISALIIGGCIGLGADWRGKPTEFFLLFAAAGLGALLPLIPVFAYHAAAFGSPFGTGYQNAVVFQETRTAFFGIGPPSLDIVGELLFGTRRGLFWTAPVMIPAVWATIICVQRRETRALAIACSLVFVWYILLNSGFSYWLGGASTGPRYLTPALGIMTLPLGLAWPYFGIWERRITLAILACSVLVNLAATAVSMTAPEAISDPVTQWIWPNLIEGQLTRTVAFKLTQVPGLFNFLPLLAVWAILGGLIWRTMHGVDEKVTLNPVPSR